MASTATELSYIVDITDRGVAYLTYVVVVGADAGVQVQQWIKVIAESDGSELLKAQVRNPTAAHLINVGSFCDRNARVLNNKYDRCLPAEVRSECKMPPVLATDSIGGGGGGGDQHRAAAAVVVQTPNGTDAFPILTPVYLQQHHAKVGDVIGLQKSSTRKENDDIDMDSNAASSSAFENMFIVVDVNNGDKTVGLLSLTTSFSGGDVKKRLSVDELTNDDGQGSDHVWRLVGISIPTIVNVPRLKQVYDADASLVVMPSDAERTRARKTIQEEKNRAEMLDALLEKAKKDAGPEWDVMELPPPTNLRRGVALKDVLHKANIYKAHATQFDEAIAMHYIFPAFHQYKVAKRPIKVGNKDVYPQVLVVKKEDGSVREIEGVEKITKHVINDVNNYLTYVSSNS